MRVRPVLLAALLLAVPRSEVAQTASRSSPAPVLRATRRTSAIHLDGRLDEPAWRGADVATDFVQRSPDPGAAATMRTEVRVLYDHDAVYVGARMYDPHPDSIVAPLARRDPGNVESDWFDVVFDSYHDRRTAFRFGVNPAGTKLDVYHFNDDDDDDSWDANWDVATRIDSLGWTAEFRVPLSQLRFHGRAGEQVWGLNFYRAVIRRNEWSHWAAFLPSAPGFVSSFGELRGFVGLAPRTPVELQPYVSSRLTTRPTVLGDPFDAAARAGMSGGVDLRVGLGSALSLNATVNPDFGQVEVDPAILNLSAVETFLPEKRPFFVEGAGIFDFGNVPTYASYGFSRVVHSRRIGRAPQIAPDAAWVDAPAQTRILGALKVSGQAADGWSVGALDAVTAHESARVADVSGTRRQVGVEPRTNYAVARVRRDLDAGRASFGLVATGVERAMDDAFDARLRAAAHLLGVDGTRRSADRRWTASGYVIGSQVQGSAAAIDATQRSSVHDLQQPDAPYLRYDSTRTTLGGHDASLGLAFRGAAWYGSLQTRETSPGFEPNDLGYLARADARSMALAIGRSHDAPTGLVRSGRLTLSSVGAWNFGGEQIASALTAQASALLPAQWSASATLGARGAVWDDRLTRGGPGVRVPGGWSASASVGSDARRRLILGGSAAVDRNGRRGSDTRLRASLVARPTAALQLSASPSWERLRDAAQYVTTVVDPTATTFGRRYVFAALDQRTLAMDARVDWTLTTALSVQLFAQPFVSADRLANYAELRGPRSDAFAVFGRDAGTATMLEAGRVRITPDASRPAATFDVGGAPPTSSFAARAVRVNAVLRWEYRPGSSFYLVWQQTRDADALRDDPSLGREATRLLAVPAENVVYVKASYRLGR